MTDAQAALAQVREAIAAGPRPGEWRVSKYRDGRQALIYDADDFEVARVCYPNRDADAALIAACSPANMSAILAHVEERAAENEQLREMLARLYAGSDLYCDDDELQDARAEPFIDFKRDSVANIRCAMVERNERKKQRWSQQ